MNTVTETQMMNFPVIRQGLKKSDLQAMANNSVESLLESGDPIATAECIAAMSEFIDLVKKDERFKSYVLDEVGKYGKGRTLASGTKIELAEVGVKYNYDQCGDPVYAGLMQEKAALDFKIKTRESFLKMTPPEGVEVRHEDELITIYPPSKSSQSSYKITIAK